MSATKVVLLTLPEWTWDKLVAAYVKILCLWPMERVADPRVLVNAGRLEILFDDVGCPPDAIDIDVRADYKKLGLGSATEKVVSDHGLTDEALPGIEHLVNLLRVNNMKGNLRDDQGSLVLLIRLAWKVNRNEALGMFRLRIVAVFWPVVQAYFNACAHDLAAVTAMGNPFTIANYARMLEMVGRDEAEVADACAPFTHLTRQSQTRTMQAHTRAVQMTADEFTLGMVGAESLPPKAGGRCFTKQVTGHLINTDDSRVAQQYFREHPEMVMLLIFAKSSGNCCIQCRGRQDLGKLYETLNELEPGLWFHETRPESPLVMRGSPMRPVRKDEVKAQPYQIVLAIKENFRYRSRRQHELDATQS